MRTFLPLLLAALLPGTSAAAFDVPARDRTVVVISIDGFADWLWDNPSLPVPTLRRLAREGAAAEAMTVSNPSITWPNHTTLVTGVSPARHGVLHNGLLTRKGPGEVPGFEQWRDKPELVRVPTVYDLAHAAGLTTAHVDWIPTTNAGTFHWEFSERPNPAGPIEREMIDAGLITEAEVKNFNKDEPAWRDLKWTQAAVHILQRHSPNLLLLHLLNTDGHNHWYGPGTHASFTAFAYADQCVREVVEAATKTGRPVTVFITTDHGFKTATRAIRPNVALRREGLLRAAGPTITHADAHVKTAGGSAMVFVTDPARKAELLPRLKDIFIKLEGVDSVVDPGHYSRLGLPQPEDNPQMGDLFLVPQEGYGFSGTVLGEDAVVAGAPDYPGHHGQPNSDPQLDGIFIAWGHGVRAGVQLPRIRNLDVAPTIAAALGLKMADVEGRELDAIWEK